MFSFHKPRVYRSAEGCCICRAKSSSSRFTDSKKYEEDSVKCFDLKQARHGEICNACVLLVKRYKRLPTGSNRHWGHVVDARAGPGMKSMTKFKKLKEESIPHSGNVSTDRTNNHKSIVPEKFSKIYKKNKNKLGKNMNKSQVSVICGKPWEMQSLPLTPDSLDSDSEEVQFSPSIELATIKLRQTINRSGSSRRKCILPKKFRNSNTDKVQFFDKNLWVERKSCCGIVFENKQLGAFILDMQNYTPCSEHRRKPGELPHNTALPNQQCVEQQYNMNTAPYELPFNAKANPTQVLKKHHLFFKRQSENFPLGDIKQLNYINTPKNDFVLDVNVFPTAISTISTAKVAKLNPIAHLQSKTVKMSHHFEQQHTIQNPFNKSSLFIHKVNSDTGKIIKNSMEKFTTLRLKPSEVSDVEHMVKTADKPFLIKTIPIISQDKAKKLGIDKIIGSPIQSVAIKFNDNSSDSGFDENLQDRKSVSPMQDDNDKKITAIPVQTMYLGSGVQVHGQQQNLLLTGNDVASKILQNRKTVQSNRKEVKIAQMHAIYSQSPDGAITKTNSALSNITAVTSVMCTSAQSSHLSKTARNITLNGPGGSGNLISSSVPSLNQKIILVKAKCNSNNNNQQLCKNFIEY